MIKKYALLTLLVFIFHSNYLRAQESMMTDVSYVFLEKLIATAKENYPRMQAFKSQGVMARNNLTQQKTNWLDGLSFSYIYAPNNTLNLVNPTFFNGYQVAVQFSVTSLFQKGGAVKQAREQIKMVQYEEEEYNLSLESQVKTRYYSYVQQLISLRLQNKTYADAQSLNKGIVNKYAKGEVTLAEYLQAQMAETSAMQAKISAEANFMTAKAILEELLTKKIEEVQ